MFSSENNNRKYVFGFVAVLLFSSKIRMQKEAANWNTGLLGCLTLPTKTIFDVGGVPTGLIPPLLFLKNRTIILNGNEVIFNQ